MILTDKSIPAKLFSALLLINSFVPSDSFGFFSGGGTSFYFIFFDLDYSYS